MVFVACYCIAFQNTNVLIQCDKLVRIPAAGYGTTQRLLNLFGLFQLQQTCIKYLCVSDTMLNSENKKLSRVPCLPSRMKTIHWREKYRTDHFNSMWKVPKVCAPKQHRVLWSTRYDFLEALLLSWNLRVEQKWLFGQKLGGRGEQAKETEWTKVWYRI